MIIEASALGVEAVERIVADASRVGASMLFYGALTRVSREHLLRTWDVSSIELFAADARADPMPLKALLASGMETACAYVVRGLHTSVAAAPRPFGLEILQAFAWQPLPQSVTDLARRLRVSSRTLQRWCLDCGLRGGWTLLMAARTARALSLIAQFDRLPESLASHAGFHSSFAMHAHFHRVFGTTPRRVLSVYSMSAASARLLSFLAVRASGTIG